MDGRIQTIDVQNERAMVRFAEDVAAIVKPGDVLGLQGDLGAGKSTFARALIRAIADDEALEVPSPTFTLVQSYALRVPILHCDLYRISDAEEVGELGLDEATDTSVVLIEWPDRGGSALPSAMVSIAIEENARPEGRSLSIAGPDGFMARLNRSLAARHFLDANGFGEAGRRFLLGDASTRAYERLEYGRSPPPLLMNAPEQPDGPPIRDGKPYSRLAHLAETVTPFVAVAKWLRAAGFAAPAIEAQSLDEGFLVIENLGGEPFVAADGEPLEERYAVATDLLAELHRQRLPGTIDVDGRPYAIPSYDAQAMGIEVDLLVDWYLPHALGRAPSAGETETFRHLWRSAIEDFEPAYRSIVLRDYHSPNLIWRAERSGIDRIGVIDFQDALIGPAAYDLASLLHDARVTVRPAMTERLLQRYCDLRKRDAGFDEDRLRAEFALMSAQRNSKILGIFVRLKERDGKPGYLKHLPRIQGYVEEALRHPALVDLRRWYEANSVFGSAGDGA